MVALCCLRFSFELLDLRSSPGDEDDDKTRSSGRKDSSDP
jgi:hypothetical protein